MKHILDRHKIQAQKPVVLENLQLDPADESLPAPHGRIRKRKQQTEAEKTAEVLRYQRTLAAGALIDNHATIGKPGAQGSMMERHSGLKSHLCAS